jgi:hypothetical protein
MASFTSFSVSRRLPKSAFAKIIVKEPMCYPCPRTSVTYVPGLYRTRAGCLVSVRFFDASRRGSQKRNRCARFAPPPGPRHKQQRSTRTVAASRRGLGGGIIFRDFANSIFERRAVAGKASCKCALKAARTSGSDKHIGGL